MSTILDLMSKSQWANIIAKLSTDYWKYKGFDKLPDGLKGGGPVLLLLYNFYFRL